MIIIPIPPNTFHFFILDAEDGDTVDDNPVVSVEIIQGWG